MSKEQRDSKGHFVKGNKEGNRFVSERTPARKSNGSPSVSSAVEAGRKGGLAHLNQKQFREALLARFNAGEITADMDVSACKMLLAMTREQLVAYYNNEDNPASYRTYALLMSDKDPAIRIGAVETIKNRAIGKPKRMQDVEISIRPPINIVDV